MSYESPIKVIYDDFVQEVTRKFDDTVIAACQNVNIVVDKEELAKALAYDRGQYLIGLEDGKKARRNDWIPVSERMPKDMEFVLCYCRGNQYMILRQHLNDWYGDKYDLNTDLLRVYMKSFVIAWMPLPQPYKEKEE